MYQKRLSSIIDNVLTRRDLLASGVRKATERHGDGGGEGGAQMPRPERPKCHQPLDQT